MALVSVKHFEGMGDHYLQRVVGFRPNDPGAVVYAAEQLAEHIGTKHGGDGYGYPLDYGEGPGWASIDVHGPEDGRAVITLSWYPTSPAAPCRIVRRWEFQGKRYWSVEDADDRRWTYGPLDSSMAHWEVDYPDYDPEYWTIELVDPSDPYDARLLRDAREWGTPGVVE